MLYCVRVISGREMHAIELIKQNIEQQNLEIKSLFYIPELKGYLFLEGEMPDVMKAIYGVKFVKNLIKEPVELSSLERYLKTEKQVVEIDEEDIVEVLSGPFKGEKAKVTKVDPNKKEIVIELLEAAVPIPITISMNIVRVVEKKKKKDEEITL